jgi:hypothetical protein
MSTNLHAAKLAFGRKQSWNFLGEFPIRFSGGSGDATR